MKTAVFLFSCFIATTAFGQVNNKEALKKQLQEFNKKHPGMLSPKLSQIGTQPYQPIPKNFTGVYLLPDGMPCVVPDTKDIAALPNAYPNPKVPFRYGRIPNGAPVKPVIPQSNSNNK